ncbi:MAG: truA [Paenibacillaceae bacterium]|jgi:tRNA pseudouridine38-40 synthase|nr:truA [Paenibacillaceae bacterium]
MAGNLRMVVSYDGTSYHGFQTQPTKHTIQDKLEAAIYQLTGENIKICSSGRTDAGVHARCQVINFHTASAIPAERWALALNARLPRDIVVIGAEAAPEHFHARRSAKQKTYCYRIRNTRYPDVFARPYELHHYGHLDVPAMSEALSCIEGTFDFSAFCSIRSQKKSHVRTVFQATLETCPIDGQPLISGQTIRIFITGSGFLYQMVRIIVGTVLQIGEGKRSSEDMRTILLSKDRSKAGPTAPSHGLTLWDVEYT